MPHKDKEAKKAYAKEYYRRLKSGEITSRGTKPVRDLTGLKFGHLTAIRFLHREGFLQIPIWEFLCDCGNIKALSAKDVVPGRTTACGCMSKGRRNRYGFGSEEPAKNCKYAAYRVAARNRNLPFELSKEDFFKIVKMDCTYCGIGPINESRASTKGSFYYCNGVDRVDNSLGYTKENSVPCCGICNRAKHTMSATEFIAWLDRVTKFRTQCKPESPAFAQGNESNRNVSVY